MKTILGLDLGTNSIGWALIQHDEKEHTGKIIDANSRIIPMNQAMMGDFDKGNKVSQTAERTRYRGVRRLIERGLLRRERLHRVMNLMKFLPAHYAAEIDFDLHPGQFINHSEPKINYYKDDTGKYRFLFMTSFQEMMADFASPHPEMVAGGKKIPYDWTIYYLRKKALSRRIEKEELAWLLLNFNQKRGYYQLRGEDEEEENTSKQVEFYSLKVVDVIDSGEKRGNNTWYNIVLENGWIYRRQSRTPLDWIGQLKDFIVTTEIDEDGNIKKDKEGYERRSFRSPSENDWTLIKKKTEKDIENSRKTVGTYIYDALLANPAQKIKGKLIRTIERKYYKEELKRLLEKQKEFHPELTDESLYQACIEELYPFNSNHKASIADKGFTYLFIDDIIFYQRPLKSKKSSIATCKFEWRVFKDKEGNKVTEPIRCIPKSHPLFQEFRLWNFMSTLKIYQRLGEENGKPVTDLDVTQRFLSSEQDWEELFTWLNEKKEIKQDTFLKYPKFGLKKEIVNYRWNYVEDKIYPCNETHALINSRLKKVGIDALNSADEFALWHILYSVNDRLELKKSLTSFAKKKNLPDSFVEVFSKFPSFDKEYGAYSVKAIRKLLSLMRLGKYWDENVIDEETKKRINKLIDGEYDDSIRTRVREKAINLKSIEDFKGLPSWLASYIIYNRHSESGDILKWKSPADIEYYLKNTFKQHSLKNPVVEQVLTETLRVVKDIWEFYGEGREGFFDEIHIELGREIKNTAEKRKKLSEIISKNENTNLRIKAMLMEFKESGSIENVRPYSPMQQEIFKIFEEDVLKSGIDIPEDILKISQSSQPTKSEILRYKLWLEQKYCSPYTGDVIPLSKLFTPAYEIEHIIPQSLYFDDSLSNKVICEAAVNKDKGNRLAYEYIKNEHGRKIELGFNQTTEVFSVEAYEQFIKNRYSGNKAKMKKLLLEDIPESFVMRQLNDSRYISRTVQKTLSAIVRADKDDDEANSKNIISCNGVITSELKQHWGLNDVWNEIISPRFERLNALTNSNDYGEWTNKDGKKVFQIKVPLAISKGFSKKRIDHRHHVPDAIVIACATRNHINYLNNKYAKSEKERHDLRRILCNKTKPDDKGNYKWVFKKPWDTFTQDTREKIMGAVVSFKQNLRIINKTVNHYQKWIEDEQGNYQKRIVKQIKGDSWAIRKPMHKETVYGKISLRNKKLVTLSAALDDWNSLVDKHLKSEIKKLIKNYGKFDKKTILKYFKDRNNKLDGKDISKVEIYYFIHDNAASRVKLDQTFNSKKIATVSDTGIQAILKSHLSRYNETNGEKVTEHPELAFSPDGINVLNKDIVLLNKGKFHKPIYSVRTFEPIGNKFTVGNAGKKGTKYVEAAKGTNLFFAIYQDESGKRSYETIPLNIIIERQKQGMNPVPEMNEKGVKLLFSLSPNDLVYIPTQEEIETGQINWENKNKIIPRLYKIVSFTGNRLFSIPVNVAKSIVDKEEFGVNNKIEFDVIDNLSIKEYCIKIKLNRLGIIFYD